MDKFDHAVIDALARDLKVNGPAASFLRELVNKAREGVLADGVAEVGVVAGVDVSDSGATKRNPEAALMKGLDRTLESAKRINHALLKASKTSKGPLTPDEMGLVVARLCPIWPFCK